MTDTASSFSYRKATGIAVVLAAVGVGASLAGWMFDRRAFYFSYLTSFVFVMSTVLCVLFLVMLHHLTGSVWSTVVRRPAEHVIGAMPALVVLLLPVLAGMHELYVWSNHDKVAADHAYHIKEPYLNVRFFLIRAAIYLVVWMALARFFRRRSFRQDLVGDARLTLSMRRWSAPSMFLFAFTFTFACFDWVMSLDYHWFSTIFGVYVFSGGVVSAFAVLTMVTLLLMRGPLAGKVPTAHLHDLGKYLFAFSVFWAYIAFSQYFLIWYANIPEETIYYLERWTGLHGQKSTWWFVSVLLPLGRFALPFLVMMSASVKRNPRALMVMSVLLLFFHWLDCYWMVMPYASSHGPALRWLWLDAATVMAIGGIIAVVALQSMSRQAAYPMKDPNLHAALAGDHHGHDAHAGAVRVQH